jgi:hypothetical protein
MGARFVNTATGRAFVSDRRHGDGFAIRHREIVGEHPTTREIRILGIAMLRTQNISSVETDEFTMG